jgi:hypothetical protein
LLFTRPMYSSINFGFVPAAWILVGCEIKVGIVSSSLAKKIRSIANAQLRIWKRVPNERIDQAALD